MHWGTRDRNKQHIKLLLNVSKMRCNERNHWNKWNTYKTSEIELKGERKITLPMCTYEMHCNQAHEKRTIKRNGKIIHCVQLTQFKNALYFPLGIFFLFKIIVLLCLKCTHSTWKNSCPVKMRKVKLNNKKQKTENVHPETVLLFR